MPKIVVYIISICSKSTYPFFSNEMFMYREQIFMYTDTYKLEYTRKSYHFIDESSYNTHNYCCYEFHKMIPFWYVNTLKLKFSLVNVCLCWIYLIRQSHLRQPQLNVERIVSFSTVSLFVTSPFMIQPKVYSTDLIVSCIKWRWWWSI